ncbi:hypothetical protein ABG827_09775, partial [Phocaeicola vulgatus]|nr:hypothetical protein [Phocaeicola vulgatus]MDB0818569.1 hypothetical protein [Phocaeicola vulgatus]MDB0831292.1 hypothetical protein [Phocaeicola vulgatus]MDB0835670.1 hypothetical protein [Phocaeicola vulgatus]MDC1593663.1 hypothetical protein [Phocaeicola vulgatus]
RQTLFSGEYLKIQKSQLIRNTLCMNQLADFVIFNECPSSNFIRLTDDPPPPIFQYQSKVLQIIV